MLAVGEMVSGNTLTLNAMIIGTGKTTALAMRLSLKKLRDGFKIGCKEDADANTCRESRREADLHSPDNFYRLSGECKMLRKGTS